jgi:hypothetical protein
MKASSLQKNIDPVFEAYLKNYAKSRSGEVSSSPLPNFVSADIAIDFFEEGKRIGEDQFRRKVRMAIDKQVKEQVDATLEVITLFLNGVKSKGFKVSKLFIAVNVDCSKLIFTVPKEQHYTDEFINLFYPLASDFEHSYSKNGIHFYISAIDDSSSINFELLKADGYDFFYDLINNTKLN